MSDQKKINALHVLGSLRPGGIETWLINLVRLRHPELQIDFLLSSPKGESGSYEEEAIASGCRTFYRPRPTVLDKFAKALPIDNGDIFISEILKHNKYDVLHVHGVEGIARPLIAAANASVPVRVAHCHSAQIARGQSGLLMAIRNLRFRKYERSVIIKNATDLAACSNAAGELLAGDMWWHDKRCRVVNCGIPLAKFEHAAQMANRDSWLKKYNLQSHVKVIGHIGSMGPTPIKNHCFLVDVFKVLSQRRDDCILFMGGDGPLRLSIEKKVNDYGLKNKVIMPGVISDVPGLMTQLFDVNVVPSVSEGFGVVVTEGVAAGLYNIVSCGVPLQASECFPGRVERVGLDESPIKWSERIERAIELKIPQHEASAAIRRSGFAIEQSAEALLQIYKSRIRGPS